MEAGKQASLAAQGIALFRRRAAFVSPHEVDLGGQKVRADKIILAVGAHAVRPAIPGIELAITSDEALALRELPASLVMIGGGVIAMEFAHIWNAVGVQITILELGERILSKEDGEIAEGLTRLSQARGIAIHTRTRVQRVERTHDGYVVTAQTLEGEHRFPGELVMLAAGRVANTEGLRLEAAGVQVEKRGISTNEYLQTTAPHIYAGGDAVGRYFFTPVATYEGKLAARNALQGNVEKADYSLVTHTVFTLPPASAVGLTEEQARQQGLEVAVTRVPFSAIGRAVVDDETEGFVKIIEEKGSERLLGAHILGPRAEELIHEFAIAMKGGLTRQQLAQVISIHPSLSEGVIGAAVSAERARAESCCE